MREEGEMGEQKRGRRGEICERGGRDGGSEERETGRDMWERRERWGNRREGDGERYVREEGEMGEQKRGRRGEICERGGRDGGDGGGRDGGTEERETGRDM